MIAITNIFALLKKEKMISEIIKNRRAVYPAQYNDEPIKREEIEKILETANWAPTHRKTEPWRFKVFHGKAQGKLADFLAETYKNSTEKYVERTYNKLLENPKKAGCMIAICMQRDPKESVPEWEEIAATAMAVQNMWLTASSMNIGSYWSTPGVIKYLGELIPLAKGEKCIGLFYLGRYDIPSPEGNRKTSIQEKTTWI